MASHNPNTTPLWDFVTLDPNAILSSIMRHVVEANNFQFNSAFITLFQQNQFSGSPMDNPSDHITSFLEK